MKNKTIKTFEEQIIDAVKDFMSSGKFAESLEKHVGECIDEIIKDSFRWSGNAKKSLEADLQNKLSVPLGEITLAQYNVATAAIVEKYINHVEAEKIEKILIPQLEKYTGLINEKEIPLATIIAKYIESLDKSFGGEMSETDGEITLIVEHSSAGFTHVYFDKETGEDWYRCENSLHLNKGEMYNFAIDKKPFNPFAPGNLDDFESFIFKLYANKVKVIGLDEEIETEYYREDVH